MLEKFQREFEQLTDDFGFLPPIKWKDATGFTLVKEYSNNFKSLYKIGIKDPDSKDSLKKLIVMISYGKSSGDSITIGSGERGLFDPVDLNFDAEFSYDTSNDKFYYRAKEITTKKLLIKIKNLHELPTKKIRGFFLRCRLGFWRKLMPSVIKITDKTLSFLLRLISGDKVKESDILQRYFDKLREERTDEATKEVSLFDLEVKAGQTMEFFGYKAKREAVVFYSVLHLIMYSAFFAFNIESVFLGTILKNNFLALCYVVFSFIVTEKLLPKILKFLIGLTTKYYPKVLFKRLKI